MTGTSWEHQREVRDALKTVVSDPELGVAALSSAQTMSNLLKDLLPDAPRETSVLVAAAEAGLAQVLLDHVGQGMDIGTASSLTASAFAARTPFTADACRWVVGELSVALGLAPGEPTPAPGAQAGPSPARMQPTLPAQDIPLPTPTAGDAAETILPPRAPGPATGAGWVAPGYGPAAGTGQGGPGPAYGYQRPGPPAGVAPPAPGYRYPPPPAPPPSYGYPRPPRPGQGQMLKQRRTPKAWMILTGAVVIVAVIGVIAVVARHADGSGTAIEPLSQIIKPDVTTCGAGPALGMPGVTRTLACHTHQSSIDLNAYQFGTAADYQSGLSRLNNVSGWTPAGAGTSCPPPSGQTSGQNGWHSDVNPKYPSRQGQILECYPFRHSGDALVYLWTLPTQRVILIGTNVSLGASFTALENWWMGITYG